ncbi:putative trna (guanine(26)-n(2))-dimethyltransferase 2 [Nicotiana attenuata]|uniref:Trna (Guanine(26)-n(2))-dimethyltransferase 2 n=1 Tax=Nicotiana attenuata TaxID=49451 RepID=A0A314KS12_NICAT|nr:putative trna (guanine(26)-n(2))-dimethyltransferase 2 [Nicotiana attenuata]
MISSSGALITSDAVNPHYVASRIHLHIANFARAVASFSKAQAKKVARFLPNPEKHWGRKLRAGRQIKHISLLGTKAVHGFSCLKDSDEPAAKRKKTEHLDSSGRDTLY